MNIGFEYIDPEPTFPPGLSQADFNRLKWSSQSKVAIEFKTSLKIDLREAQRGRCCFCRRFLFDDYATHIEHFIDKDSFPEYTFSIRNLALSCGTCNFKKNGYFRKWMKRTTAPSLAVTPHCSPVTNVPLPPGSAYPSDAKNFRWVNPYTHSYSEHIELVRGWMFRGLSREGRRTIRWLKLNEIGEIERRALAERMEGRGGILSMMVHAISELSHHRAKHIGESLTKAIKRRSQIRKNLAHL